MPADGGGIEEHLRAKQRGDPRRLRIPLVPADEDAYGGVARLPDLEAVRFAGALAVVIEMAIARREVILLVKQRIVRDVHLPIDAEKRAVRVDYRGRISIDARGLTFEERDNDDDLQLPGNRLHPLGRRPGNRLRQVEPVTVLRLAEVLRIEQFFQTDDLRPAAGGVAHEPLGTDDVGRDVLGRMILDEAYGEGGVRHVWTTVYGRNRCPYRSTLPETTPSLSRGCSAAVAWRLIFRLFSGSSLVLGLILPVPRAAMAMCICRRMTRATWWMA